MRKFLFILAAIFLGGAAFLAFFIPAAWLSKPAAEAPKIKIEVTQGQGIAGVAATLKSSGVIMWETGYRLYGYFDEAARKPKVGEYRVQPGMSYRTLARALALGSEKDEVSAKVIEGWTLTEEAESLEKMGVQAKDFFALVGNPNNKTGADKELAAEYPFLKDLPQGASLEGYLFPDTYRVWKDQLPTALVKKQLDQFAKVTEGMETEAKSQGRNFRDVLILASIVEREASGVEDQKIVAGIYLNRLKIGMPLQSDATVNYITGAGRARPTLKDLESVSPYNTYKNKGLPPGPICNPGTTALQAALHPTKSDYLYYLHDAEGKAYYARNLEEHKLNRWKAYRE